MDHDRGDGERPLNMDVRVRIFPTQCGKTRNHRLSHWAVTASTGPKPAFLVDTALWSLGKPSHPRWYQELLLRLAHSETGSAAAPEMP